MNTKINNLFGKLLRKNNYTYEYQLKKESKTVKSLSSTILDKKTPAWKPFLMLSPAIILLLLFTIVPMINNLFSSFTDSNYNFTLNNYNNLFTDPRFAIAIRNSFMYGILVLPFVMMISLIISSLIASLYRKYAKGFWQTIFFTPYITNGVAVSLAFVQIFASHGVINNILGVQTPWLTSGNYTTFNALIAMIIFGIWNGLAFNILIFTTAMLGIDKNIYKSAAIDGTSGIKAFFTITIPSIKGTINFLITLAIIGGIKVFPLALFQNKPIDAITNGASTIMIYVYLMAKTGNFAAAGAASIALFIIGATYSSIIRGGFFTAQLVFNNLGERNVWVKVKNTKSLHSKKNIKKS